MVLQKFLEDNLKEIIIGIAVGTIIAILGDFTIAEGIGLIVLGPLIALILNQLSQVFIRNERNQRTAFIILTLIGGYFIMQYFQLGIFSTQNFNVPIEQQGIITGPITKLALGGVVGGFFPMIGVIAILLFFLGGPFAWIGVAFLVIVLLLTGVPIITLTISIVKNFSLILIIGGMIAFSFMIFKTKQIKALSVRK